MDKNKETLLEEDFGRLFGQVKDDLLPTPKFTKALEQQLAIRHEQLHPAKTSGFLQAFFSGNSFKFAVSTLVVILTFSTTSYAYTSDAVTEGSILYPVKRGIEQLQESILVQTPEQKVEFYEKLADRRIRELEYLKKDSRTSENTRFAAQNYLLLADRLVEDMIVVGQQPSSSAIVEPMMNEEPIIDPNNFSKDAFRVGRPMNAQGQTQNSPSVSTSSPAMLQQTESVSGSEVVESYLRRREELSERLRALGGENADNNGTNGFFKTRSPEIIDQTEVRRSIAPVPLLPVIPIPVQTKVKIFTAEVPPKKVVPAPLPVVPPLPITPETRSY